MHLRRPLTALLLTLIVSASLAAPSSRGPAPAGARRPSAADIERIREALQARQAERATLSERESLIPWKQLADTPDQKTGDRCVLVRLRNQTNVFRAAWTFTPERGNAAAPVRTLLCWRGEQWIALPPGEWRGEVALGRLSGARAYRFPLAELKGRRGEVYELTLDGPVEQEALAMERAAMRKLEALAARMREPEKKKPDAAAE